MRHGAKNVRHGAKNVNQGAKKVRHCAENVHHDAEKVRDGVKNVRHVELEVGPRSGLYLLVIKKPTNPKLDPRISLFVRSSSVRHTRTTPPGF